MRAIIIQDADARALLDKLKLEALTGTDSLRQDPTRPATREDMHRSFHYVVVRWLQEHGANVVG